jgi:hypothetical protein
MINLWNLYLIKLSRMHCFALQIKLFFHILRDVNRFWSSRRKLKSSRKIDADRTVDKLGALNGRGSGINGAKSCILGLSWHLISLLKLHFFVLFFSYICFYNFLITCITVYSLLFEKAVQWTLFTSLFARGPP